MPAKSRRQYRLMAAACHDAAVAKRIGISQETACEFVNKTPGRSRKKWARKKS